MTSEKQIEANQANSLKSTGPKRTRKVKYNAVKHGIFARGFVIEGKFLGEDKKEFQQLLTLLAQDFQPVQNIEFILIQKIANSIWRLKRLYRAEIGELLDKQRKAVKDSFRELDHEIDIENITVGNYPEGLQPNSKIIFRSLEKYRSLLERIQKRKISEQEIFENIEFIDEILNSEGDIYSKAERQCGNIIKFYELLLEKYIEKALEIEEIKEYKLGDHRNTDLYLRYETTIERQLYRALHELERIQNKRLGGKSGSLYVDLNKD